MASADRYRLGRLLHRGPVSDVFEAKLLGVEGFERRVVLKRMRQTVEDEEAFRAYIDEAQITSKLQHRNIVSVLDFGRVDGLPFQVLEMVDGVALRAVLDEAKSGVSLPRSVALFIAAEVASALECAHQAKDASGRALRIVHRDVTPQNIILSWRGDVRLTDFGIALARERLSKTQAGYTKGKLGYMAPEQVLGGRVDGRTDLFALGCVLHELLTGRTPAAPLPQLGLEGEHVALSDELATELRELIAKATAFKRKDRHENAAAFQAACEALLGETERESLRIQLESMLAGVRRAQPEKTEIVEERDFLIDPSISTYRSFRSGALDESTTQELQPALRTETLSPRDPVQVSVRGSRNIAMVVTLVAIAAVATLVFSLREPKKEQTPPREQTPLEVSPRAVAAPEIVEPEPKPEPEPEKTPEPAPKPAPKPTPQERRAKASPAQSVSNLQKSLAKQLRKQQLSLKDLATIDALEPTVARWKNAIRERNEGRARESYATLVRALDDLVIDRRTVEARLDQAQKALALRASTLDEKVLESLDDQYLDLSLSVPRARDEDALRQLLVRIRALESRISAAANP